jgi:hypothetical protein
MFRFDPDCRQALARALAAASFTTGGIETLSVSREAGQPLIPNQGKVGAIFEALPHKSVKIC